MKRILLFLLVALLIISAYSAWQLLGPTIKAPEGNFFYIKTGEAYPEVSRSLKEQGIIKSDFFFNFLSKRLNYDRRVKPGRYEITDGESLLSLVRKLKAGRQSPVKLVIKKLRTKEDLASRIGKLFESDSSEIIRFLHSNDSLRQYGFDTNTMMAMVIPETYLVNWNKPYHKIFDKFKAEYDQFWNGERRSKADSMSLTPGKVIVLASIVEEESNIPADKKLIASVYLNRLRKNMKLQADPTVKFALRDFSIRRVLFGHLKFISPYNTYQASGLPPGPICTPSKLTIDLVLNAPKTDYLYFAASPAFDGTHNFAATYQQHLIFAKQYQQALDSLIAAKSNSE